jgi:hypothetical protein
MGYRIALATAFFCKQQDDRDVAGYLDCADDTTLDETLSTSEFDCGPWGRRRIERALLRHQYGHRILFKSKVLTLELEYSRMD